MRVRYYKMVHMLSLPTTISNAFVELRAKGEGVERGQMPLLNPHKFSLPW
jgi:hypothetical protein